VISNSLLPYFVAHTKRKGAERLWIKRQFSSFRQKKSGYPDLMKTIS